MLRISYAFLTFISLINAVVCEDDSLVNNIVKWVRSEGGYFNEKIEMRRVDPSDPSSYFGVFAKEDIDSKEVLMHIPRSCYIEIFDDAKFTQVETEEGSVKAHHQNLCMLAKKLTNEMTLGEDSRYAPYIAYLKTQKPGQLPVNWSKAGKDLLRKLLVPGSDGVDWIDRYYKGSCIGDDPFENHMMEMTIQRCFDTALIPIWDMVNHDNGRMNTEHNSIHDEEGLKVQASMEIKAGEEILGTYDLCTDCNDIAEYWGTPEILRDFGFVERYPTRWVFENEGIWFEIFKDKNDDNERAVFFGEGSDKWTPTKEQVRFLQNEILRLHSVGEDIESYQGTIPENEYNIADLYYETATRDLALVVEHALWDFNIAETNQEL